MLWSGKLQMRVVVVVVLCCIGNRPDLVAEDKLSTTNGAMERWEVKRLTDSVGDQNYEKYILKLPECDRVEVLKLGGAAGKVVNSKLVLPTDRTNLYHVEPYDEWHVVVGRQMVSGTNALELVRLYRSLKPNHKYLPYPTKTGGYMAGANCHDPLFAYYCYSTNQLIYHTSISWDCENIVLGADGKRKYFYFDSKSTESQELLRASRELFRTKTVPP